MKLNDVHQTDISQDDLEKCGTNNDGFNSFDTFDDGAVNPEANGNNKHVLDVNEINTVNAVKMVSTNLPAAATTTTSTTINNNNATIQTKLYFRRWIILGLFVLNSMMNAFQWIEYSIIADIIHNYYQVTYNAVNWTSMVYMVAYIPLIFPASWLLDRYGLRNTVLLGSLGTAIGAWIKCGSISPDRFYVTMIGQTLCGISQIFILGIPSHLAAFWFGAQEVSTACSIGVFGNQLGVALGFLLPPVIVVDSAVSSGLTILFYSTAGAVTVLFVFTLIFFAEKPPCPPSLAAVTAAANPDNESYLKSIRRLARNINYILLLVSYGINVGVYYAVSTLLSQVVLIYFPDQQKNAGFIGLTIVVAGMAGSVLSGIVLDKTHKFKQTTIAVYLFSFLFMVAYTVNFLAYQIWLVFVVSGLLGFFMTGYLPVGFEFAAELTYPEPEGTSSGLLNASSQVFGIIFTLVGGWLITDVTDIASNSVMSGALFIGLVMTVFIKADLRRRAAQSAVSTPNAVEDSLALKENGCGFV